MAKLFWLWCHVLSLFVMQEEKVLRNNKTYQTIDTNKNGVRFRNNALRSLNDDFLEAKLEYAEMQKNVVSEVISIASGYADPLSMLSNVIAVLDVLVTFAHVSAEAPLPYRRPRLHPKGQCSLNVLANFVLWVCSNAFSSEFLVRVYKS